MAKNDWVDIRAAKFKLIHTDEGDKFLIECNGEDQFSFTLDRWEFVSIFGKLYDAAVSGEDAIVRVEVGELN